MKRTKVQIAAIFMDCPHCEQAFANDSGSEMIDLHDDLFRAGATITCPGCGKRSVVPASAAIR